MKKIAILCLALVGAFFSLLSATAEDNFCENGHPEADLGTVVLGEKKIPIEAITYPKGFFPGVGSTFAAFATVEKTRFELKISCVDERSGEISNAGFTLPMKSDEAISICSGLDLRRAVYNALEKRVLMAYDNAVVTFNPEGAAPAHLPACAAPAADRFQPGGMRTTR